MFLWAILLSLLSVETITAGQYYTNFSDAYMHDYNYTITNSVVDFVVDFQHNIDDSCHITFNGTIYDEDESLFVLVGDNVSLYCTCDDSTSQWKLNGMNISEQDEYHYVDVSTGELSLLSVRDAEYTCTGNNSNITIDLTTPGI